MTIEQIINRIKENNKNADIEILKKAYEFAKKAHKGQKRKTGGPYLEHALHTAFVLAQIKADFNTIIAGILHDVPEDTEYTLEDIKKEFGSDVATLVEGITKLSKIKYRGVERYRENLRKMFLAMANDMRVILIKFCDRLHNIRTLEALPEEKRLRIAKETMEVYVPIAGLLGIWSLKSQMEDICFKYLHPEEYKKLEYKYEVEKKVERNQYSREVKKILEKELKKEKIKHEIEDRLKPLYSIYKKMGIIHSLWKPKPDRIKDYIAIPKPNGYRSLHTTVYGPGNKATEFQIKTKEMHEESLYGIAAHWYYKEKGGSNYQKQPKWVEEILQLQSQEKNTNDFIDKVKLDVFHDRIFVFSPKGDVFDLPEGSTPIDFAFLVHTEIGNKATGVLINDKMSTLDKRLQNGDLVEIIIEKKRKYPNQDWLKFVQTRRAKEKIKQSTRLYRLSQLHKMIPGMKK